MGSFGWCELLTVTLGVLQLFLNWHLFCTITIQRIKTNTSFYILYYDGPKYISVTRRQSQWPSVFGCSLAGIVGSNPTWGMDVCLMSVLCVVSRGLCVGLITRPEESYRMCAVSQCDRVAWIMWRPWPTTAVAPSTTQYICYVTAILFLQSPIRIFIYKSCKCIQSLKDYRCYKLFLLLWASISNQIYELGNTDVLSLNGLQKCSMI
jgi:hypothetical protein